jgi:polyhydroxyalkanoate synthesis repressor PhaR
MAYVIKRYSNRKLYDTQESRYVTLEEIEEMIRAGREISVADATSGEDLTSVTLTQIILENERNHRANLPSAFLHQLIKHGEAWHDFVQRTMRSSLEGFVSSQRDMERVFREWSLRAGWGPVTGAASATADAKRDAADAKRETPDAKRETGDAEADKLRDEVSALRDRLRSLEERLQKRKADAK